MNDDVDLLRCYAENGSDTAFAELVHRYVDLVYGAAMRRTSGDAHLSADVAQQVFTALARNAAKLSRDTVLGAWLHTATRNAALTLMISEKRRHAREFAASTFLQTSVENGERLDWERLRPLLDNAIDGLPPADRTSLILRFFERKAFAEIGAVLRISEDAARMRTERAMDKLRAALARHGITSSVSALAAVVSAQPLLSAPAGLASGLAAQSLSAVASGTIAATLASFMTAKIIIPAMLSALVAFGVGTYVGLSQNTAEPLPLLSPPPGFAQTVAALRGENDRLNSRVNELNTDLTQLRANVELKAREAMAPRAAGTPPLAPSKSLNIGLERYQVQEAMLNNLRQIAAARDQYIAEKGHAPKALQVLVGRGRYIKTVRTVGGEDYSGLAMTGGGALSVTTPDGISVTFDPTGAATTKPDVPPEVARFNELRQRLDPVVNKAVAAYIQANNGKAPANEKALLPYFATPQEGADFIELVEAQKAGVGQ